MCRSNVTNTGFNAVLGSIMLLTSFSSNDLPSPCRLFCSKPFHSVPHRSMLHCNTHIPFCSKFLHNIVTNIPFCWFHSVSNCSMLDCFTNIPFFGSWNHSLLYQMAPCYIVTKHCILLESIPFHSVPNCTMLHFVTSIPFSWNPFHSMPFHSDPTCRNFDICSNFSFSLISIHTILFLVASASSNFLAHIFPNNWQLYLESDNFCSLDLH